MGTRSSRIVTALATIGLLASGAEAGRPGGPGHGGDRGGRPASCDSGAVSTTLAAIAERCPCEGRTDDQGTVVPWRNHGQYVRCVARATRAAVRSKDGLRRRCLSDPVHCAARSTCGAPESVVNCTRVSSGTCVAGSCGDDRACTTDADCAESACALRRSASECVETGGVAGLGSCCSPTPIGSPSGAFVDGVPSF